MHTGTCSFSKVVISFPKRMSGLQALQIMSLPIVPTYPNLLLDNIWSIQFEHGMTTRWRCTSAKISMKGKADWSLCFKQALSFLWQKLNTQKAHFDNSLHSHLTSMPVLSILTLLWSGRVLGWSTWTLRRKNVPGINQWIYLYFDSKIFFSGEPEAAFS